MADDIDLSTSNDASFSTNSKVVLNIGDHKAIIGDTTSNTFKPKMEIGWFGSNFTIGYNDLSVSGSPSLSISNKMVIYDRPAFTARWYQLSGNQFDGKGIEFDIVIKSKPGSNQISFPISAPDYNFYYQPFMNEINSTKSCNATSCFDKNDNEVVGYIKEEYAGSYAIYHKSKANNQYQTGKAFHITRPLVIDSNGSKVYANISLTSTTMTIKIPQGFIDKAVYPIIVDPTFGYTPEGGSAVTASVRTIKVFALDIYNATCGDTIMNYSGWGRGSANPNSNNSVEFRTYTFNSSKSPDYPINISDVALAWWQDPSEYRLKTSNNVRHLMIKGYNHTIVVGNSTAANPTRFLGDRTTGNVEAIKCSNSKDWNVGNFTGLQTCDLDFDDVRLSIYATYYNDPSIQCDGGGPTQTISFMVFTLGNSGINFTNSMTSIPGNSTERYFFNTTSQNRQFLNPCSNVDRTSCQNGPSFPAYRIRNTGNVNISIRMNISAVLGTGIKLCANSTAPTGLGCSTITVSSCDISGSEGNLNSSANLPIALNIGQSAACYDANVTLYMNVSTSYTQATFISRTLTMNSSNST